MSDYWSKQNRQGTHYILQDTLGNPGAEGQIYRVQSSPDLCGKVFHEDKRDQKKAALEEMIKKSPKGSKQQPAHIAKRDWVFLAWPIDLLYDSNGNFCGYVMPYINGILNAEEICREDEQREHFNDAGSLRFRLFCAQQMAFAFECVHKSGYIIGD